MPTAFKPDFGFSDYMEWALDVPMYFVVRGGHYHDCTHVTFRQFMNGALKGEIAEWQPTMGDWTNHLSTLFPDVRLKRFLEMRGADGGPWRRICALPAFWVGLLYDDEALSAAEELTRDWGYEEVLALRDAVPAKALAAEFRSRSLFDVAREVLTISRNGLKRRNRLNGDGIDESQFLAPLDEVLAKKATLAEDMLSLYHGRWNESVEPVLPTTNTERTLYPDGAPRTGSFRPVRRFRKSGFQPSIPVIVQDMRLVREGTPMAPLLTCSLRRRTATPSN